MSTSAVVPHRYFVLCGRPNLLDCFHTFLSVSPNIQELPFTTTVEDIKRWFSGFKLASIENPVQLICCKCVTTIAALILREKKDNRANTHSVIFADPTGRFSGMAYVAFKTCAEVRRRVNWGTQALIDLDCSHPLALTVRDINTIVAIIVSLLCKVDRV